MLVIKYHSYYRRCKTKNLWCYIDTCFEDVVGSVSLSLWTSKAANTSFMTVYNLLAPTLPKIHYEQSLTHLWHFFSGCGRACVSARFDHHGGQYIENKQWCTNVNIFVLTVAYLNPTIYSETQNADLEIGTDSSSQTQQNLQVDGCWSGFGSPRGSRSGCWTGLELDWPVPVVQTRIAGTSPDALVTLDMGSLNPNHQSWFRIKGSDYAQYTACHTTPLNSTPFNSTPFNSTPFNSTPFNSTPFNSTPFNSTPFNSTPFNSTPFNSTPLNW